jgi:diguanylate cyclase (GGDEF)-like protein
MMKQRSQGEAALILAGVFGVSVAVFSPDVPPVQFLVMPTVLLASFRLGPLGAALSTVIVAIVGSLGTVLAAKAGANTADEVTLRVFNFQLNLAVLFLTALPIGAAMAQRAQLEQDLTDEKERADRFAKDMASLANIDDLTGLATRRFFLDQLDHMAATARRIKQPLTLAMIDIDHFKPINDKFGHAVGDAVLMAIGAACRSAVRGEDVIGRLGGEEFAMLMPLTDQDTAYRIVDRLREAVAAIAIPTSDGRSVSVTISVGMAMFADQQIDRLLLDADRALYVAKERGRNRIVLAERVVAGSLF